MLSSFWFYKICHKIKCLQKPFFVLYLLRQLRKISFCPDGLKWCFLGCASYFLLDLRAKKYLLNF